MQPLPLMLDPVKTPFGNGLVPQKIHGKFRQANIGEESRMHEIGTDIGEARLTPSGPAQETAAGITEKIAATTIADRSLRITEQKQAIHVRIIPALAQPLERRL